MSMRNRRVVHAPYEVGRIAIAPGTVPFVFRVVFQPEALTAVGVLAKLVDTLTEMGIPILLLKISAVRAGEALTAILIADLKGKERMIDDLVQKIKRAPYVSDVQYAPPVTNGIAMDVFSFPLTLRGVRSVILTREVYEGLIKEGWARFGTPYAILLYTAGYGAGLRAYAEQAKITGEPDIRKLNEAMFQALGFGRLEIVSLDDARREAVVRIYDSFECQLFLGAGEIRGNLVRGLVAGWLAGHWGVSGEFEVLAREVKCVAKGDPYCEFVARVERRTV